MLTCCPSPLLPDTVAVTTTSVSLLTKFLIHRSFLAECPGCATRSNLRADERVARTARKRGRKGSRAILGAKMADQRVQTRRYENDGVLGAAVYASMHLQVGQNVQEAGRKSKEVTWAVKSQRSFCRHWPVAATRSI